jgi:hypothetical protein
MVADFRLLPAFALQPMTELGWNDYFAIPPVPRLPWKGCNAWVKIIYLVFTLRIAQTAIRLGGHPW